MFLFRLWPFSQNTFFSVVAVLILYSTLRQIQARSWRKKASDDKHWRLRIDSKPVNWEFPRDNSDGTRGTEHDRDRMLLFGSKLSEEIIPSQQDGHISLKFFSESPKYFSIEQLKPDDENIFRNTWGDYCPFLNPWLIKPVIHSSQISGLSSDDKIMAILHKRKERTVNKCISHADKCCILQSTVAVQLLLMWFTNGLFTFSFPKKFCCKTSVMYIDESVLEKLFNVVHGIDHKALSALVKKGEINSNKLGRFKYKFDTNNETLEDYFNNILDVKRKGFFMRTKREAEAAGINVNTTSNSSLQEEFHQISLQNNIDANWSMVCILIILLCMMLTGCWCKLFEKAGQKKVYVEYHEGINLMSVNDLVRRKARYLPIFQYAWQQLKEESRRKQRKEEELPMASFIDEEEGDDNDDDDDGEYLE